MGQLAKWQRDSTVIDSISRTINTDSLYRLFRAALPPQPMVPIVRALNCESDRLSARYGSIPADAEIERMNDTLWRGIRKADVDAMNSRLNNVSIPELVALGSGQDDCGVRSRLDSLDGTNLTFRRGIQSRPGVQEAERGAPDAGIAAGATSAA